MSAPTTPLLSQAPHYTACPHCKSTDIKGPHDTPVGQHSTPPLYVTRAWFCRQCWWDTSVKLRDDIAEKALAAK